MQHVILHLESTCVIQISHHTAMVRFSDFTLTPLHLQLIVSFTVCTDIVNGYNGNEQQVCLI